MNFWYHTSKHGLLKLIWIVSILLAGPATGQSYLQFEQQPVFEDNNIDIDTMSLQDFQNLLQRVTPFQDGSYNPSGKCQSSICNGTQAGPITTCPNESGCSPAQSTAFRENEVMAASIEKREGRRLPTFRPIVALLNNGGNVHCTGVIISPNQVLTAAHCLCDPKTGSAFQVDQVFIGNDIRTKNADGQFYTIKDYDLDDVIYDLDICDPNNPAQYTPDIAVIEFDGYVSETFISRPEVPASFSAGSSYSSVVVGFGRTGTVPIGKTKVFGVFDPAEVRTTRPDPSNPDHAVIIVENPRSEVAVCNQDSGGPLFRGRYQIAVTTARNRGSNTNECYPGGIFTTLTQDIIIWIKGRIN